MEPFSYAYLTITPYHVEYYNGRLHMEKCDSVYTSHRLEQGEQ